MKTLIPSIKPKAPANLKKNVLNSILKKKSNNLLKFKKMKLIRNLSVAAAVLAICIILPFVLKSNEMNAMTLLQESIKKTQEIKSMVVKLLMKTRQQDNFDAIDLNNDFSEIVIKEKFDNQKLIRVEKEGRLAIFDGEKSYLWIKHSEEVLVVNAFAGFFGEDVIYHLLNPTALLENAQKIAELNNSKTTVKEKKNQIILTIETKAQGNYDNPYLKNSSISDSDSKSVYVFNSTTKLLEKLEISILIKGKYKTVLKTESIKYDLPITNEEIVDLPKNLNFKPYKAELTNAELSKVTSKVAVEKSFKALIKNDISNVKEFFEQYSAFIPQLLEMFNGSEILEIGEPFKSGQYPGEFVPIKIKFSNGETRDFNFAVRNDNKNKAWVLDGGL